MRRVCWTLDVLAQLVVGGAQAPPARPAPPEVLVFGAYNGVINPASASICRPQWRRLRRQRSRRRWS